MGKRYMRMTNLGTGEETLIEVSKDGTAWRLWELMKEAKVYEDRVLGKPKAPSPPKP